MQKNVHVILAIISVHNCPNQKKHHSTIHRQNLRTRKEKGSNLRARFAFNALLLHDSKYQNVDMDKLHVT